MLIYNLNIGVDILVKDKMDAIDFDKFITNKDFKTSNQFNNNPTSLLKLINYVKNLPVDKKSLQTLYDLLKFYRTPLFIVCQPIYQRIIKDYNKSMEFQPQIQQIATFVKNYLEDYKLQQLKFFYIMGLSKKKKKMPQKSEGQRQFLKYIQTLGQHLLKLKKQISQIEPDKLKLQLDAILAGGLERKLNTLQQNYEQYFKNQADKIYNQNKKKIQQEFQNSEINKGLEPRPQYQPERKTHLCCRTYFYDLQIIKQPENLVLQYKNYFFPFGDSQIKILKKTVCGFLNTDGGTIFLGIQQNVDTKKRKVLGMQLNENQKQSLLFSIRKDIVDSIQPDIITNKLYWVNFVPIKQKQPPHHYIAGRYLVKITIKYGQRNQIYSYKYLDRDYFAFRTQNQVIHREGRQILNAYRQRLKSPLPIPPSVHDGPCASPQKGCPILAERGLKQNYSISYNSNEVSLQKKNYKQKDAMDFIITQMTQQQLLKRMSNKNMSKDIIVTSEPKKKICFVKTKNGKQRQIVISFLSEIQCSSQSKFFEPQRGIQIQPKQNRLELALQACKNASLQYKLNNQKNTIEFRSTQESVRAFLILRQLKINSNFIGC